MGAHEDTKHQDVETDSYLPQGVADHEPSRSDAEYFDHRVAFGSAAQSSFTQIKGLPFFQNNSGLLLIALSQGFASLMGVFVKKLNALDPSVHPLELIWVRMVMTWIICVAYMSITKVPDPILGPRGIRILLAIRGFAGFIGLFGTYYALQFLSLSDATVLSFLTPMATAITGAVLLKEDITMKQIIASLASFVGVVLIARPEFLFGKPVQGDQESGDERAKFVTSAQRLGAVGVALLGVVGLTSAYTTIRAIGKRAHPMHNLGAFSLFCILTAPIVMAIARVPVVTPDNVQGLSMILAVSASGFAAQMTMTTGLQRETAGRGTLAIYVQVIFALIFERIFFHTTPPPLSLVGTVIILSSAIYIALSKQTQKPAQLVGDPEEIALEEGLLAGSDQEDTDEHETVQIPLRAPVPVRPANPDRLYSSDPQEKFTIGSTESLASGNMRSEREVVGSSRSMSSVADT